MAEVRRATSGDLDALVEMGRAMHAESPNYRDEPFEPDVCRTWLVQRIGTLLGGDSVILLAVSDGEIVGAMVGMTVPRWFNRRRIAAELIMYVKPEHRGGRAFPRLVHAFKKWARAEGASKAMMGVSTGIHPERTVRAYERMGGKVDGHNLSFDI